MQPDSHLYLNLGASLYEPLLVSCASRECCWIICPLCAPPSLYRGLGLRDEKVGGRPWPSKADVSSPLWLEHLQVYVLL